MKKFLSVTLLVVLIAGLLFAIVGCGGDKKQAQEYMKKADELQKKVEDSMSELQSEMSTAFNNVTDVDSYKAAVASVKDITARLLKESEGAIAAYEKILGLNGVEDYKEYAKLNIEAGETCQEMLKTTDDFLDKVEEMVVSGTLTGDAGNTMLEEFQTTMTELTEKLEKTDQKADDLKKEKNL